MKAQRRISQTPNPQLNLKRKDDFSNPKPPTKKILSLSLPGLAVRRQRLMGLRAWDGIVTKAQEAAVGRNNTKRSRAKDKLERNEHYRNYYNDIREKET